MTRNRFVLVLISTLLSVQPALADESCNLNVRKDFESLVGSQSASRQWVEFHRTDATEAGPRTVARDEAVFAAEFRRVFESNAMRAPNDFTFRSGWILNSQFAFSQGETLPIRAIYNLPSGETFYALQPRAEPHLTIFARPDGTLCGKVLSSAGGVNVFLVREYKSKPATKLEMATPKTSVRAPLTLRIVYLGASGGIATFRILWSQEGQILQKEEVQYDQTATRLQIAGLEIPVRGMSADTVDVGQIPMNDRIAWASYWTRWFRD